MGSHRRIQRLCVTTMSAGIFTLLSGFTAQNMIPRTRSAIFGGLCNFNWRTIEDHLPSWLPPASLPIHGFTEEKILLPEVSHPIWNSPPTSPATAKQPVKLRSFSSPSFHRVLSHAQSCEKEMLHRQAKKYLSGEALLGPPQSVTSRSHLLVQSHLYTANHSSNLTIKINCFLRVFGSSFQRLPCHIKYWWNTCSLPFSC